MTYTRFEELPVWREAMRLAHAVYDMIEANEKRFSFSFRDQLERATLSVSNNIAEGFERGTTNELLSFIYISRGSAGEVRSMLCFIEQRHRFQDLKSQISNLKSLAESCSRQLRAWAESLQNTTIKGPRHLDARERQRTQMQRRAEAFQQKLLNNLPPNHPLRRHSEEVA
jgi:four helix bundle protein